MQDPDIIRTRFEAAKSKRSYIESELQSAYFWTSPMGAPLYVKDTSPDRNEQFDSTASEALDNWVSTVSSFLIPRHKHWVHLGIAERFKQTASLQLTTMLGMSEKILFEEMEERNFYLAADESLKDCAISGTGAIGIELTDDGLFYQSLPMAELYYLDDGACEIDVVFRVHKLPIRTVVAKYPDAPDELKKKEKERPDDTVEVIEAMLPGKAKWTYDYSVWLAKDWTLLHEQVSPFKNMIVYRGEKQSGNTWGDSPIRKALGDIKTLNLATSDYLDASALAARPPMLTDDPTLTSQKIEAGGMYVVDDLQSGPKIKPIMSGSDFRVSETMIQNLQTRVRQQLMSDILPLQSDRMTTAEVNARQSEFFRRIGATSLRLAEEFLKPVIRATIKALQSVDKIQRFKIDNRPITLETDSLAEQAEADKRNQQFAGLILTVAQATQAMQALPFLDATMVGLHMLRMGGFPSDLLPTDDQARQMVQAKQLAQTVSGAMQTMKGQGSPDTAASTGTAVAGLLQKAA